MAKMRYFRGTGMIFPKISFTLDIFFYRGAIDHAPQIFLRVFSGAGAIAPVS
jgi:hypothetical protein